MLIAALLLTGLAALIHVYIFYMESIAWTSEKTRATFGMELQEAENTKEMAFNQGFYNLFLAIITLLGILFVTLHSLSIGATLIFAGAASMVAAALVLFITSPDKRSAALKQGIIPLLGIIALALAIA